MFHPTPAPSLTGILSPTTDRTTSPTTTSGRTRLRGGINYLRTYTQNHILSRDSSSSNLLRNSQSTSGLGHSQPAVRPSGLVRSTTYSPSPRRQPTRLSSTNELDSNRLTAKVTPGGETNNNTPIVPTLPRRHSTAQVLSLAPSEAATESQSTDSSSGPGPDSDLEGQVTAVQEADEAEMTRTRSATTGDLSASMLPTIRLSAYYDSRSNRQSLSFSPISRTLPTGQETIKVGRYSERENHAAVPSNTPSAAPVGFKSKVVSRRHCEFYYEKNKWYIKDVKSSSGTFLNHIRLSPPGTESKPFVINDGDIVQLGIDFRGGEEMIFRCVKMRVELNRGWQAKPNTFNVATHKRLRNMTSAASTASHAQDCSICLNAIAPCQSLFVAPCSHTWHFKCIREMLMAPAWPIFTCPNCRAAADLDADVEEPEEWQQLDSDVEEASEERSKESSPQSGNLETTPASSREPSNGASPPLVNGVCDDGEMTVLLDNAAAGQHAPSRYTTSNPVAIPTPTPRSNSGTHPAGRTARTPSPNGHPVGHEGPLTPRNDVGPFVFDGDAGRASRELARQAMNSLDAATARVESNAA